ncbi:hypothetical protein BH09VER1_BH09VER1_32080 [soil metagenome]
MFPSFRRAFATFASVLALQHAFPADPSPSPEVSSNLFLGNPSQAGTAEKNNYLLEKKQFALSYNNEKGEPNWVSWRLIKEDLGEAPRKGKFSEDTTLPEGFNVITTKDYQDCGFDRGHICPHGDRASTKADSYATFVMTNIVPQSAQLNRNAWNQEEIYLRSLASGGNRLYIVAGPIGAGGTGAKGPATSLAGGKVVVPAACWKIAVITPDKGTDDLKNITADSRVLSIIMPNDTSLGDEWAQYRTSVAEIEKQTGLHFFTALPKEVADALKQKVDAEPLPPPTPPEWQTRDKKDPAKPAAPDSE